MGSTTDSDSFRSVSNTINVFKNVEQRTHLPNDWVYVPSPSSVTIWLGVFHEPPLADGNTFGIRINCGGAVHAGPWFASFWVCKQRYYLAWEPLHRLMSIWFYHIEFGQHPIVPRPVATVVGMGTNKQVTPPVLCVTMHQNIIFIVTMERQSEGVWMRRWRDSDVREEPGHYRVNISWSLPITNRTLPPPSPCRELSEGVLLSSHPVRDRPLSMAVDATTSPTRAVSNQESSTPCLRKLLPAFD